MRFHLYVKMKKTQEGQGKNVILGAFAGSFDLKHVIVVDEDVDIHNPTEVEWAVATRFQADRDLVIVPESQGSKLDPSNRDGVGAKMGLDATKPLAAPEMHFKRIRVPGEEAIDVAEVLRRSGCRLARGVEDPDGRAGPTLPINLRQRAPKTAVRQRPLYAGHGDWREACTIRGELAPGEGVQSPAGWGSAAGALGVRRDEGDGRRGPAGLFRAGQLAGRRPARRAGLPPQGGRAAVPAHRHHLRGLWRGRRPGAADPVRRHPAHPGGEGMGHAAPRARAARQGDQRLSPRHLRPPRNSARPASCPKTWCSRIRCSARR